MSLDLSAFEDDDAPAPAFGQAPPLPVEGHVAACVIALMTAKAKCDAALFIAHYTPRDVAGMAANLNELSAVVGAAIAAHNVLNEIRSCKGQA